MPTNEVNLGNAISVHEYDVITRSRLYPPIAYTGSGESYIGMPDVYQVQLPGTTGIQYRFNVFMTRAIIGHHHLKIFVILQTQGREDLQQGV